jgi:hypothetical protein
MKISKMKYEWTLATVPLYVSQYGAWAISHVYLHYALDGVDTDTHVTVCLIVPFWFIAADGSWSVISNTSPEVLQTKICLL